jgi:hypothetical protein
MEREVLAGLLAGTAEGMKATLALRGELALGKTALIDDTVAAATAPGTRNHSGDRSRSEKPAGAGGHAPVLGALF